MWKIALSVTLCASMAHAAVLKWEDGVGFRSAPVQKPASGKASLALLPPSVSGINFTNRLSVQRILSNHNLMNGSGVALGDFDGDGWCDIYLCNLEGANALYRNRENWTFEDVTLASGVACTNQSSTGAVFADVNGDRRLDLIVTALGGPNSLFINQGNGKFVDTAATAGISSRYGAMSMALADIDGNGTLDLYIANYGATSILRSGGALNLSYVNGKPVVRGRYAQRIQIIGNTMFELGEPDALYLNDGTGKFNAVSWSDGRFLDENGLSLKEAPWDQGLSVMFRDVNGDHAPDIYVCNDAFTPDRFWINDGKGRFRAMNRLHWRSTSHFSMGVDFADFDRDGDDDFFVLDMLSREHHYLTTQKSTMPPQPREPGDLTLQAQMRRNTFFENRGDGTYAEVANLVGLAASEWSWNPTFIDVDLDGWEDLLVSNGFPHNMDDLDTKERIRTMGQIGVEQTRRTLLLFPKLETPNMAFRNNRNSTFTNITEEWGFNSKEVSNGFALADLDNDGDQDIVVNPLNGPALVYQNDGSAPRILVRLKGKAPNTYGIGAKIVVHGGPVRQSQEIISGGRFVSSDDPARVFACGNSESMRLEVTWRNGTQSIVEGVEPNRIYEIDEASAKPMQVITSNSPAPWFQDASDRLSHRHHESQFDDFEKQPSLPHRLSRNGSGATWFDLDQNGWDDLIHGTGRGGRIEVSYNNAGQFQKVATSVIVPDDTSTILAWRDEKGVAQIIVGLNSFESANTNALLILEANGTNITQTGTLRVSAAIGPLALTQAGENKLLFAGGHFVPNRFPEPAPSHLFIYQNGNWSEIDEAKAALEKVGAVTAATWTDLDGNGSRELLVASDWGVIRVFEFTNQRLTDRTGRYGLDKLVGRWQSIATGDFDADGKIDFVAGNWGLNSFYNQAPDHQVELYFGDFDRAGPVEMIEAYRSADGRSLPWRQMGDFERSLPWIREAFPTHAAFASASVSDILTKKNLTAATVRTTTLASTLFLNRGERFEPQSLPREAQFTPVFGLTVADFDLDGFHDILLAQNFFAGRESDGPMDAGRGLILRGGAGGKLSPLSAAESGIASYGEQRGCAATDFDHDGKVDLVLTQNGGETKLFQNRTDRKGIRVHLENSIGTQLQADSGPIMDLNPGEGYWSQSGGTRIVPEQTRSLRVRWPSGKETKHAITAGLREFVVQEQ